MLADRPSGDDGVTTQCMVILTQICETTKCFNQVLNDKPTFALLVSIRKVKSLSRHANSAPVENKLVVAEEKKN